MRAPLCSVLPGWVDHYGHMNLAYYLVAFDLATDALWPSLGLGKAFREKGLGTFAAESWQAYTREVTEGAPLAFDSEVLAYRCEAPAVPPHDGPRGGRLAGGGE